MHILSNGATETELAELNGIPRIWDYGKTKWEIKLQPEDKK